MTNDTSVEEWKNSEYARCISGLRRPTLYRIGQSQTWIFLEDIFQRELDQSWSNRRLIDNTVARGSYSRSRILVLSMIPYIKELGTKGQRRILTQPTYFGLLHQRRVPGIISRSTGYADAAVAVIEG